MTIVVASNIVECPGRTVRPRGTPNALSVVSPHHLRRRGCRRQHQLRRSQAGPAVLSSLYCSGAAAFGWLLLVSSPPMTFPGSSPAGQYGPWCDGGGIPCL